MNMPQEEEKKIIFIVGVTQKLMLIKYRPIVGMVVFHQEIQS